MWGIKERIWGISRGKHIVTSSLPSRDNCSGNPVRDTTITLCSRLILSDLSFMVKFSGYLRGWSAESLKPAKYENKFLRLEGKTWLKDL